jgi:co-chaperonin GroES (HSP10)
MEHDNLTEEYLGVFIEPTGFRMIAVPYFPPEKTKGGIYLTDYDREEIADFYMVSKILAIGDEAFSSKEIFPNGPRVNVGDWVHITRSSREDKKTHDGIKYFYLNDSATNGIIPDFENNILKSVGLFKESFTTDQAIEAFNEFEQSMLYESRVKKNV